MWVRGGVIAEVGAPGTLPADGEAEAEVEVVEGGGRLYAVPAFVDPTPCAAPGEEHKEDVESGTRAVAAGGTGGGGDAPTRSRRPTPPERLRAVRETAAQQAHVPVGFLAALTRDLAGDG